MGLDTVELVLEMEETFGIVFDDLAAEKIGTVGQAYRYILSQVELRQTVPCPSASLFYKLRRTLTDRYDLARNSFRPSAPIADFLPERGRREAWISLRDEVGMTMPQLEFGPHLRLLAWLLGLSPVLSLVAMEWSRGELSAGAAALASLLCGAFFLFLAFVVLTPFARQIPAGCETIRGTIETTLGRHRLAFEGKTKDWQEEEVWFTLLELISQQTGVPRDLIKEESSFIHDLGMD